MKNYGNVVIVTHESTTGPAHDLRDYLKDKTNNLLFISHPLLFVKTSYEKSSYLEFYKNGRLKKKSIAVHFTGPELILYLKDSLLTFYWVLVSNTKWNLYVGNGNLNAFVGLLLKLTGRVNKVIFYCIDYVPERFSNKLLNNFYHFIDRIAVENCDKIWNLSRRMSLARERKWDKKIKNQIVVPIGAWFGRIKRLPFSKVDKSEIIYMGALIEKQGIQLVLKAMPKIRHKIKDVSFTIIGRGPYEKELKSMISDLNLEEAVNFMGYIEDHREVENTIAKASLAVATYPKNTFTYYTDPGKVKSYLAAGVPVVITKVPLISYDIEKRKCGIIVDYDENSLAARIIEFLSDEEKLKEYRKNALEFAKEFDWNKVFDKALND